MDTIKEILIAARDSLTPETWGRNNYFSLGEKDQLCMCSHGAVQRLINPRVKQLLGSDLTLFDFDAHALRRAANHAHPDAISETGALETKRSFAIRSLNPLFPFISCVKAADSAAAHDNELIVDAAHVAEELAYQAKPGVAASIANNESKVSDHRLAEVWENRKLYFKDENPIYGSIDAHYLLGMVGLTTTYNDQEEITLEKIKEKFNQAIALAERLGV